MLVGITDIQKAHQRIKPFIRHTPVLTNDYLNALTGGELYFKCENLQHIGAFKARGAMNALLCLSDEEKKKGVATHSSGNHAQALAWAARQFGTRAFIVMPENSPKIKIKGVERLGGEIIFCASTQQAREETLEKVVQDTGAFFVPPFNHEWIMAGQGTAALELLDACPQTEIIITPVGGGGLLSGSAIAAHGFNPSVQVFAGEPEWADDAFRSMQSGKIEINTEAARTCADGLRTHLGDKTFAVIRQHVQQVITVSEEEIQSAMQLVWENLKIIIEPSSAVPVAAVLKEKQHFRGKKTGIIISGGNVDLATVPFLQQN